MLQISVPSRTDVKEYQELKEEMDQLVGRINGKFTTPNWSPIRYIYGCVSQMELAAFYRDSAVALVTPLRDGNFFFSKFSKDNLLVESFLVTIFREKERGILIYFYF